MILKKKLLRNCKIYLILDREVNCYSDLLKITKHALKSGVNIFQLRDKSGKTREIIDFSKKLISEIKGKALFIVNDRVDIAKASGADGVHLGQEDLPVSEARKIIGKDSIVGVSCQTFKHAKNAQKQGADYIGFGSIYKTLTKPGRIPMDLNVLCDVVEKIEIPIFPIGGITVDKAKELKLLGFSRLAVCRAICKSEVVSKTVKDFLKVLS